MQKLFFESSLKKFLNLICLSRTCPLSNFAGFKWPKFLRTNCRSTSDGIISLFRFCQFFRTNDRAMSDGMTSWIVLFWMMLYWPQYVTSSILVSSLRRFIVLTQPIAIQFIIGHFPNLTFALLSYKQSMSDDVQDRLVLSYWPQYVIDIILVSSGRGFIVLTQSIAIQFTFELE